MPREDPASPLKRLLMTGIVPPAAWTLIQLLGMSWRFRETDREHLDGALADPRPTILAFLHGRTFTMLRHVARMGGWVSMCSKSLDGEAMARVEERLGLDVVRGSSGRDGLQAIQEMIRRVRRTDGPGAALAVDGSARSPRPRPGGRHPPGALDRRHHPPPHRRRPPRTHPPPLLGPRPHPPAVRPRRRRLRRADRAPGEARCAPGPSHAARSGRAPRRSSGNRRQIGRTRRQRARSSTARRAVGGRAVALFQGEARPALARAHRLLKDFG